MLLSLSQKPQHPIGIPANSQSQRSHFHFFPFYECTSKLYTLSLSLFLSVLMGNLNQAMKCLCTALLFLVLVSYSASSPSSNQQIQPQNPSPSTPAHYSQVFYLKNTSPMFLGRQEERFKKKRRVKRKNSTKHRKKMVKNLESRPFSVMLPKGFVPPSRSSPCHNKQPNSVSFHCHLSAADP